MGVFSGFRPHIILKKISLNLLNELLWAFKYFNFCEVFPNQIQKTDFIGHATACKNFIELLRAFKKLYI